MSGVNTVSNKFNYDSNLFTPQHGVNYFNDKWQLVKSYRVTDYGYGIPIKSTSMLHLHGSVNKNIATNKLSYCKITTRGYGESIYVPLSPYKSLDQFDYILFFGASANIVIVEIQYYDKSEKAINRPYDVNVELYVDVYSM